MKLKLLSASILLAMSSAAMAVPTTVTDLGTLNSQDYTAFERSWTRFFPNTPFGFGSSTGAFEDRYLFELASPANAAAGKLLKFDFGTLNLVLNSVTLTGQGQTIVDTSPADFSFVGLGAGKYTLDVAGIVSAINSTFDVGGAQYQGTIRSFVSTAPEPATLAMMLAGLAAIGAMVAGRRRG